MSPSIGWGGNFLEGDLFEFALGPGFEAGTNIRIRSTLKHQERDHYSGVIPLYSIRFGPISVTNTYEVQDFTTGKDWRAGLLLTVRGHPYQSETVQKRRDSLFGGAYLGFKTLTLFNHTDLLKRSSGSIYTLAFTPALYHSKNSSLYLIFNGEWMDQNYVDYYFGVTSGESSTVMPAYMGKTTLNFSARLAYKNQFSKYAAFLLWVGEKYYGRGVTDSPTVGKNWEFTTGFGFLVGLL